MAEKPYVCNRLAKLSKKELIRLAQDQEFSALFWEQERRLISRPGREGFLYFLENYGSHRPTGGGSVEPLDLWQYQRESMAPALAEEKAVICLKARRVGFTLITIHYMVWMAAFKADAPSARCVAISKNAEDASALLDTARLIVSHIPVQIRPETGARSGTRGPDGKLGRDNTRQFSFPARGSQLQSFASSKGAGRSHAATILFLDELAWVPDGKAEDIWVSALPTTEGGGQVVVGSTGQGRFGDGATFAQLWDAASSGQSPARPIFVSWRDRADRTPPEEWYEETRKLIGDDTKMRQEYPETPEEALSGNVEGLAYTTEHINAAESWARQIEEDGLPDPAGGAVWLGIDWGANSAAVLVYPLAGDCLYIADEYVSATDDAETFSRDALKTADQYGKLDQAFYDAAGAQPMRSFARMAPGLTVTAVPFGNYKRQTVEHLRMLLKRAADKEQTGAIAISPRCETLLAQLRNLRVRDDGSIDKKLPDHTHDALIAALAEHGEVWHSRYAE